MKPNLTAITGFESSTTKIDIGTKKEIPIARNLTVKSITQQAETNDALTINKSGYDEFISKKGINSTVPSVLSFVPLKDRDVEKSIINMQRTLNKTTLTDVQNIINMSTGSFTQNELIEFENEYTENFKETVEKLTAAYKAKADYLSFISNVSTLNMSDVETWILLNPVLESTYTTHTIDFSIKDTSGIKSSLTIDDWLENTLKVSNSNNRFNITKMLQAMRNCYAMLKMGDITTIPAQDSTYTLEKVKNDNYTLATSFIESVYKKTISLNNSSLEQIIDNSMSILSKDVSLQFSSGFSLESDNVKTQFEKVLGNVAKYDYEQDLSADKNVGVFYDFISKRNNNKFVLSIDNNLTSQTYLSKYINADQYYLIGPLSTGNTQAMKDRLAELQGSYQKIFDDVTLLKKKMQLNNDGRVFFAFFKGLSTYCDLSFMTNIPSKEMFDSILRFSLLQYSLSNFDLLKTIFKIMMYRDRLRNTQDYESDSTKADIIRAKSKGSIKSLCKKIAFTYLGLKEGARPNTYAPNNTCIADASKIFTLKIGNSTSNLDDAPQVLEMSDNDLTNAYEDLFKALLDEDITQFDIFYDAAKSLEGTGFSITSSPFDGEDPLSARVGTVKQFVNSTRDHRAIVFFMKAMLWFKNLTPLDNNAILSINNSLSNNAFTSTDSGASTVTETLTIQYNYDVTFFARLQAIIETLTSLTNLMTNQNIELARKTPTFISSIDSNQTIKSDLTKEATTLATTLGFSNYVSVTISDKGLLELTENLTDDVWTLYDTNIKQLSESLLLPVIKKSQYVFETFEYMTEYLTNVITLLEKASTSASEYVPTYNENLATLYTNNSIFLLKNILENSLNTSDDMKQYTRDIYQDETYLKGMLTYANTALPTSEDSFVVILGIPYGMIERMGAFRQNTNRNIVVKLTFRDVNFGTKTTYEIEKTFPATSFINQYTQKYTQNDYASESAILKSTFLVALNESESIVIDTKTQDDVKAAELVSHSTLEYLKILYGLDFSMHLFTQNNKANSSNEFLNSSNSIKKINTNISKMNIDSLITSRYQNAVANAKGFKKQQLETAALQGPVFDKIIAIPIDSNNLRASNIEYLNDMIATIDVKISETTTSRIADIDAANNTFIRA